MSITECGKNFLHMRKMSIGAANIYEALRPLEACQGVEIQKQRIRRIYGALSLVFR
jgi:hypothetical protein